MPSLRDTSLNAGNWRRLGIALALLGTVGLLVWGSIQAHHHFVTKPRLLEMRHDDPVGYPGMATTQITGLGEEAVPTLVEDITRGRLARSRSKSIEMLSGIVDPRVVPALTAALKDPDLGVRVAAVAGLARTADPKAGEALWTVANTSEDFLRYRVEVALGLTVDEAGARKLLAEAAKAGGHDRILLAWAAGYALRRLELTERFAKVPAGPEFDGEEQTAELQKQVDEVHAAIAAGKDLEANARLLSELTSANFSTWNYGHQIGYQTLAVKGPRALRGMARIDAPLKPRPELEGLHLEGGRRPPPP